MKGLRFFLFQALKSRNYSCVDGNELRYSICLENQVVDTKVQDNNTKFEWPVTVYYEDTDAGGVVYHSNYLKFFERARTELLRTIGVSQQVLLEQNLGFVVRHMDIDFLQGARLDDHLTVITQIADLKKASLTFCQEIVNPDGNILCKAMVKVACIDNKKMRPKAMPQSIVMELTHSDR